MTEDPSIDTEIICLTAEACSRFKIFKHHLKHVWNAPPLSKSAAYLPRRGLKQGTGVEGPEVRPRRIGTVPKKARTDWLVQGTRQGGRCGLATSRRTRVSGSLAASAAAVMATGERVAALPPLWPVEARLAALLPDLLVFRKPRGSEPELATAQGVLLGVHVTGEGRRVALPPSPRGGSWGPAPRGVGGYGPGAEASKGAA